MAPYRKTTITVHKPPQPKATTSEPKWLTVTELTSVSEELFGISIHKMRGGTGTFSTWAINHGIEKRPFNFLKLSPTVQQERAARVTTDTCNHPAESVLRRCKFEYSVSSIREAWLALQQRRLHEAGATQPLHAGLMERRVGPRWLPAQQIKKQFATQLALLGDYRPQDKRYVDNWLGAQVRQGTLRRRKIDWTNVNTQRRYAAPGMSVHGSGGRIRYEYNVSDLQKLLRKLIARQTLTQQELAQQLGTRVTAAARS